MERDCSKGLKRKDELFMKYLAKDIKNRETIKYILDSLKSVNEYIDTLREDSFEYDDLCEKVADRYLEIDEALVGKCIITDEVTNLAIFRTFTYWDYIKEEITWNEFVNRIKKYSNKLLIDLD